MLNDDESIKVQHYDKIATQRTYVMDGGTVATKFCFKAGLSCDRNTSIGAKGLWE